LGAQIEYDKRLATVRTIGSGRVTLDFNPPLAGKTLVYEVTVQKQLKTADEKISALIHRRIPAVDAEKFVFTVEKANLTVNVPEDAFYIEGLQLAKRGVTMDVQRFLPELTGVQFVEVFKKPELAKEPEKAAKKKPAKKAAKKTKPAGKVAVKKAEKAPAKKAEKKTAAKKTTKKAEKTATKKATKKSS
jgi:peptidylprolyl isomerase